VVRFKQTGKVWPATISLLFVMASLCAMGQAPISSESKTNTSKIRFSVVSVKENRSGEQNMSYSIPRNGDSITYTNFPLFNLVIWSNNFHRSDLVFGMPEWTKNERFDLVAKVEPEDVETYHSLPAKQRMAMFQEVLADRFKLQLHMEPKELPALVMTVAKGGSKLKPADPNSPLELRKKYGQTIMRVAYGTIKGEGATIADLALFLTGIHGEQFIDKTGLTGTYDFTIKYADEPEPGYSGPEPAPSAAPSDAPELTTALRDQLGIQVKSGKAILDSFVVDHIEQPTPN
jgi:uncharacterized protein (TIGR03435 family)